MRLFELFRTESFYSIWYWLLTIGVWTQFCHRTIGVPYDMLLRAERLPAVAAEVDALAGIVAARLAAIHRHLGAWLSAGAGFTLAALAVLGFSTGFEVAQAAFLLLLPLAVVALQTLRLATWITSRGATGRDLRRALARRRAWNQAVAIVAILTAAVVALFHRPPTLIG